MISGSYKGGIRHLQGRYQVVTREVLDSHKGGIRQLQRRYHAVAREISGNGICKGDIRQLQLAR